MELGTLKNRPRRNRGRITTKSHDRFAKNCLEMEGMTELEWPCYSPDLHPIEHLWDNDKRRIKAGQNIPDNREQNLSQHL